LTISIVKKKLYGTIKTNDTDKVKGCFKDQPVFLGLWSSHLFTKQHQITETTNTDLTTALCQ